jgi:hypothetical protein
MTDSRAVESGPEDAAREVARENTRRIFVFLNQVKADPELTPSAFLVAFEITQRLWGADHEAWPGCRTMAKAIGMSEATVIAMVRRLEGRGHLAIESGHAGRGHSHRYRIIIKPQPAEHLEAMKPQPVEVLARENLSRLNTKPQPAEQNYIPLKKEIENLSTPNAKPNRDGWPGDAFQSWYAAYPRKKQRKAAARSFEKVRRSGDVTFDQLMAATVRHANEVVKQRTDPKFIPYPASWLNAGSYLDEDDTATLAVDPGGAVFAEPERDPKTFSSEEWVSRLAHHRQTGQWPGRYWGPAPGSPGCLVPSGLIIRAAA